MAMKMSTRKRPERDDKMLKERQLKFSERTFDDSTIRTLKFMMNNGIFSSLDFPIQHGKEAAVYRATKEMDGKKEFLAVKIFKFEGPSFMKRIEYLEGDKRFPKPRGRRDMVRIFAGKEFANLKICEQAKVHSPKPIKQRDNIVVMEFLGEGGVPSDMLKDVELDNPEEVLRSILSDMRKMHAAKIVHVDLSEFNVMFHKAKPFIIDVGQAVLAHHPSAERYLANDLTNILKFFGKRGAGQDFGKALAYIKGEAENFI
ncbi:MAG: RIO1 family regulatory kinase/ATPase [Candidatus Micrarchaeota archaeon]